MVVKDKLKAEGGLTKAKMILCWHFNFWTLTITLPKLKHIAWSTETQKMICSGKISQQELELTIGHTGHVGFMISYHFFICLRTLLACSRNRRIMKIDKKCMKDLELMQEILDKAKAGINMNLLAFHDPNQIYYSESCPTSLGGYSNQGFAWRFKVTNKLLSHTTNNLLEYLAATNSPWIDPINGN
jgi:hypothetical protein